MMALVNFLEVTIKIVEITDTMTREQILPENEEVPIGTFLFMPGHYDLLYP